MKYMILIGDGMSDRPIESLGGKTPLEAASTPNLDRLAGSGAYGLFRSVPEGFSPGSDVANMSILGYDPALYYRGRAPLEAASIGVKLGPKDTAFRCNLVTLSDGEPKVMVDYSAGHISTEEADEIIKDLDREFSDLGVRFYTGTSYRHLMVWKDGPEGLYDGLRTTPPHDISDRAIKGFFPEGNGADTLTELIRRSWDILAEHPVNRKRKEEGKRPANSIWLWGQGTSPKMPTIRERFGLDGAIISAVDLMKGIGVYAGLEVLNVSGATGYLDTNYAGKVGAALGALKDKDLVCLHVEAPDEAGHKGSLEEKLRAIEDFDSKVVGPAVEGLSGSGEWKLLALTDHPTPVELKTHTSDPVPFVIVTKEELAGQRAPKKFSEKTASETGLFLESPSSLAEAFFGAGE